jgi:hypothetical protein
MIRALLSSGALLLWAGASAAQGVEADPGSFGAVQVGIFCTEDTGERAPAPGSVAGHMNLVGEIELRAETLVVPVSPALTFGFRAQVLRDVPDAVMRITHPPFRGRGATEQWFAERLAAGVVDHGLYTFDNGYEMVEGPWRFEISEGGRTLLSVALRMVPPSQAPQFVGLCQGPPLMG